MAQLGFSIAVFLQTMQTECNLLSYIKSIPWVYLLHTLTQIHHACFMEFLLSSTSTSIYNVTQQLRYCLLCLLCMLMQAHLWKCLPRMKTLSACVGLSGCVTAGGPWDVMRAFLHARVGGWMDCIWWTQQLNAPDLWFWSFQHCSLSFLLKHNNRLFGFSSWQ